MAPGVIPVLELIVFIGLWLLVPLLPLVLLCSVLLYVGLHIVALRSLSDGSCS